MPPLPSSHASSAASPWPLLFTGALAIIAGGMLSAALAAAPTRAVMWLVAYLVLVVGVAQIALGAGQWRLAPRPVPGTLLACQWLLFNGANALVMTGTLLAHPAVVAGGTLALVVALGLFLRGVHGAVGGWWVYAYRLLVVLLGCSALVGVALSIWHPSA